MKGNLHLCAFRLLMAVAFNLLLVVNTSAQITFVQVTDPHIFDDTWPEDSRREDKTAMASFINQINERVDGGATYRFVVMTGDLGIEALVTGIDLADASLVEQRIRQAATELATTLAQSKVKLWLFVPGNNDVLKEVPGNIKYYHMFMNALYNTLQATGSNISIVDLCPSDNTSPASNVFSRSDLLKIDDYAFIGFNDSSFKNSGEEEEVGTKAPVKRVARIESNFDIQRKYVDQVAQHFNRSDFKFAFIFYHVPEIDDPYFVTLQATNNTLKPRVANQSLTGNSYFYSSWFVKGEIRDDWNRIVLNPRVKGLFAGHFHDPKRRSYDGFDWILTPSYLPESFSKLHVCPPLALKFQRDKHARALTEQARGFQEVYIAEDGKVSSRIFWLSKNGWGLDPQLAEEEAQAARQFQLGQFYEHNQRPKEAEAAYDKSAGSTWPPTRQRAMASLTQVLNRGDSRFDKYVRMPLLTGWNTGLSALGALLPALLLVLGLVAVSPVVNWWGGRRGRNKLRIGPVVGSPVKDLGVGFEQILTMVHGRVASHYSRRPMVVGEPVLPMLTRSLGAEVPGIIESALPGVVGKVVVWMFKKMDRPKYIVTGAIVVTSLESSALFIAVQQSGRYLRTWHPKSSLDDLIDNQVGLAFRALKFLVRQIRSERGNR